MESARLSRSLARSFLSFFAKEKEDAFFVFCARGFACFKCCCARELTRSSSSSF